MNKVLLAGIDTLEVGYAISEFYLKEEEIEQLASAKAQAGERSTSSNPTDQIVTFRGRQFVILPFGTRRYNFILRNRDITMRLRPKANRGRAFPEVHITYRSECLCHKGWEYAADNVGNWVRSWARVDNEKISRADLCVDVAMPIPELTRTFEEVMCRSHHREEYIEKTGEMARHVIGHHCTGYTFGKGGKISINIYDKAHEVQKSHKEWFYYLWKQSCPSLTEDNCESWEDGLPVTRIEARLRRKFLKSMQVNTIDDLKYCQADLWRYITDDWISIRKLGVDTNRSRWIISRFWAIVRSAVQFFGRLSGVTRLKQMRPRLYPLRSLGRGVLVSIAAYAAASLSRVGQFKMDGKYGRRFARRQVTGWLNDNLFVQQVERRAVLFGARMF